MANYIEFFKLDYMPDDLDLKPSSLYYIVKLVTDPEGNYYEHTLFLTTKSDPVEKINWGGVTREEFEEGMKLKLNDPKGLVTEYIRGDGSVATFPNVGAGDKGDKGDKGEPGDTPTIGSNGNWFISGVDTGVRAGYRAMKVVYNSGINGIRDGYNHNFTVLEAYIPGSLEVYYNGVLMTKGNSDDYIELNPGTANNGATINRVISSTDKLIFKYAI